MHEFGNVHAEIRFVAWTNCTSLSQRLNWISIVARFTSNERSKGRKDRPVSIEKVDNSQRNSTRRSVIEKSFQFNKSIHEHKLEGMRLVDVHARSWARGCWSNITNPKTVFHLHYSGSVYCSEQEVWYNPNERRQVNCIHEQWNTI